MWWCGGIERGFMPNHEVENRGLESGFHLFQTEFTFAKLQSRIKDSPNSVCYVLASYKAESCYGACQVPPLSSPT